MPNLTSHVIPNIDKHIVTLLRAGILPATFTPAKPPAFALVVLPASAVPPVHNATQPHAGPHSAPGPSVPASRE
jgi:hypothetical protein